MFINENINKQELEVLPKPKIMNAEHWFVLRDLKRPNAKNSAYKLLQQEKFHLRDKLFTPLQKRIYLRFGKPTLQEVPCIPDLLFVYASRQVLDPIISEISTLQYRYVKGGQPNTPMTVREADMNRFIEAVHKAEKVEFFTPEAVSPALYGKWIRIIGGPLDGLEGRLLSKRGSKRKRLIVDLPGFLSAAIEVEPAYIQVIPETKD